MDTATTQSQTGTPLTQPLMLSPLMMMFHVRVCGASVPCVHMLDTSHGVLPGPANMLNDGRGVAWHENGIKRRDAD